MICGVVLALLLACASDPEPGCRAEGRHLVLATSDLSVGALATSSLDGTCVDDAIATVSADAFVRALGDLVVAADRTGGDAIRVFDAGAYQTPVAEFAIGRGANVHDVGRAGDRLVLTPYEEDELVVTDLRGRRVGAIDLAHLADDDGTPEADRLVSAGGELFVGLQILERGGSVVPPAGPGLLVPVDPVALDAGSPIEVGVNPKILPDPTDPDAIVLASGTFYHADGEAQRWGGDGLATLATETDLGFDLTHVLPVGDGLVLVGIGFETGDPSHLVCIDAAGATVHAEVTGWLVDGVSDGEEVWLALRGESWAGEVDGALLRVDPATCTTEVLADGFRLDPYALALVEAR